MPDAGASRLLAGPTAEEPADAAQRFAPWTPTCPSRSIDFCSACPATMPRTSSRPSGSLKVLSRRTPTTTGRNTSWHCAI